MINTSDYIPLVENKEAFRVYRDIIESIGAARRHDSYLTNEQIAMAIIAGLKVWGADNDAKLMAETMLDLLNY